MSAALGQLHVLVVDDDPMDRKLIRRALSTTGLELSVAEYEMASPAETHPQVPDIVFLDYRLPGVDGMSALELFRQRWPGTPHVLVTGQGDETIATEAFRHGAHDYIPKRSVSHRSIRRIVEGAVRFSRMQARLATQRAELQVFSHVLAHDLRAPLRSAEMLCDELSEDLTDGAIDAARESASDLCALVARMTDLIDSLESHTRAEMEGEPFRPVPACEVIATASAALRSTLADAGAQLDVSDNMPELFCDPPQIAQVLQNLIANAVKYRSERPPEIRIDVRMDHEGDCELAVRDNGRGLHPDLLERIFEPFQRGIAAGEVPGSGLGLATCRKIVSRHGGRIWCESVEGAGSTFKFTLRGPLT
ncbi:MAG: ATP-binding protein [Pseudomonadota bacterium]